MKAVEDIKALVKKHTIIPFTARDIVCESHNKVHNIVIADRFRTNEPAKVMEALGLRKNLSESIFKKPEENWDAIRQALATIDRNKRFTGVVDDKDNLHDLISGKTEEPQQVNFDERIDSLMNVILGNSNYEFQNIVFDPNTCTVDVNTTNKVEVDCGVGDLWRFGTTTSIGITNQKFQEYFLRLVCTNGMTTKENLAYRMMSASKNLAKQFIRYSDAADLSSKIKTRVKKLRDSRASLYEVTSIANTLKKDDRDLFYPEFNQIVADFAERGYKVGEMNAKRQRFTYTNENLYDVFNLATNLATHQRGVIGDKVALSLNKAAGEIFTKGPNLSFNILDIYKN